MQGVPISTSFTSISHGFPSPFVTFVFGTCGKRVEFGDFTGEGGMAVSIARRRWRMSEKGGRFCGSDSQQSRMSCAKAGGHSGGIVGRIPS
jgi:hypothetical protein